MKKVFLNILVFFASLPFSFPVAYFWRWPIGQIGTVNCLDLFLILFISYSLFLIFYRSLFSLFFVFCWRNIFPFFVSIIFLLFSFFNVIQSPIFWDSLGYWKSLFFLPILFVWLLFFWKDLTFLSSKKLLSLLWFSTVFLAIWGIYSWFKGNLTYDQRLSLFFSSPNQLAITLIPAILIGLQKMKDFWQKKLFYLYFLGTVIAFFSLWQTHSQAAIGALFVTLLFLPFFHQKKNLFFASYFLLIFVILFNWNFFLQKINYSPKKPPTSIDSRIVIWQVTREIIKKNWFWGVGLGNFQNSYLAQQKNFSPFPQWAVPHSHNLFFNFLTEMGIINLIIFIIFLFLSFKTKAQKGPFWFMWLFYFFIYGLIETPLWKNDTAILFWLAVIGQQIDMKKSTRNSINKEKIFFTTV